MKFLVSSKNVCEIIKRLAPDADVTILTGETLKELKKISREIDCTLLDFCECSQNQPLDTLPLLRRLAADASDIPVFILDSCFSLSHHNEVTNFPNVIGYGLLKHSVTEKEITNLIEELRRHTAIRNEISKLQDSEIIKIGWTIHIEQHDFYDEYADKLYLGQMRIFINNLKRIIDKIRPKQFTRDHTQKKPLLDWLEMWHAYKHGKSVYKDPSSGDNIKISDQGIAEAKLLFENNNVNPGRQHILISGGTGAGKTFIAHFIHKYYYRTCNNEWYKAKPTIVSCPELQGNLAVPTLFGCLAGAWTDSTTRVGYLLASYNGTLFLDEIGAASQGIQEKLLRYLDTQNFRPDGWSMQEGIYVPLLVVAATKEDTKDLIRKGKFREDLYYRFLEIEIPPLKDCMEYLDIYIDCELQNPRTNNGAIDSITSDAIEFLKSYNYPGNFREFHRILGLAVEAARSMRVKTIVKKHVESAMKQMGLTHSV